MECTTSLDRDHLDYVVEETWRWAMACEKPIYSNPGQPVGARVGHFSNRRPSMLASIAILHAFIGWCYDAPCASWVKVVFLAECPAEAAQSRPPRLVNSLF